MLAEAGAAATSGRGATLTTFVPTWTGAKLRRRAAGIVPRIVSPEATERFPT